MVLGGRFFRNGYLVGTVGKNQNEAVIQNYMKSVVKIVLTTDKVGWISKYHFERGLWFWLEKVCSSDVEWLKSPGTNNGYV